MTALRNLITDVPGIMVGQAGNTALASGTTAIIFAEPTVAAVDVRGGGPGTRDTELLDPAQTVQGIDGITLSGGSAFGLDAASGVQAWLREQGRGFAIGSALVPIVPGAILFDLINGGDKSWGRFSPYADLGYAAAASASSAPFELGSAGAGLGATTVNLKGGLGSASAKCNGFTVGALVAANPTGSVTMGAGPWFWAAPFEQNGEYGGLGLPQAMPPGALASVTKGSLRESTTIAVVATDAVLTKAQARRLAVMAQTGMARAIYPVHTPLDGDVVFVAATGRAPLRDPVFDLTALGTAAANCLARAIARGIYEATALPFPGALPAWRDRFSRET